MADSVPSLRSGGPAPVSWVPGSLASLLSTLHSLPHIQFPGIGCTWWEKCLLIFQAQILSSQGFTSSDWPWRELQEGCRPPDLHIPLFFYPSAQFLPAPRKAERSGLGLRVPLTARRPPLSGGHLLQLRPPHRPQSRYSLDLCAL